jgi:hypothetical protein
MYDPKSEKLKRQATFFLTCEEAFHLVEELINDRTKLFRLMINL